MTTEHSEATDERGNAQWRLAAQNHYAPGDEELTTVIVSAVAEAEGVDPTALKSPVLYDCVDASALERTFFSAGAAAADGERSGQVEFRYGEYLVRIESDGWVLVYAPTDAGAG